MSTSKSENHILINKAIATVIHDDQLIDFLRNHDFKELYYRPMLDNLYNLPDIIEENSNDQSPYTALKNAILRFRWYLACNASGENSADYYRLFPRMNSEEPHNIAIEVADELFKIKL